MEKKKSPAIYPHVTQEIRLEEHFVKFQRQLSESWMFKDRAQVNTKESLLDKIEVMIGTGKEYLKKLDDVCRYEIIHDFKMLKILMFLFSKYLKH